MRFQVVYSLFQLATKEYNGCLLKTFNFMDKYQQRFNNQQLFPRLWGAFWDHNFIVIRVSERPSSWMVLWYPRFLNICPVFMSPRWPTRDPKPITQEVKNLVEKMVQQNYWKNESWKKLSSLYSWHFLLNNKLGREREWCWDASLVTKGQCPCIFTSQSVIAVARVWWLSLFSPCTVEHCL